MNKIIDTIAWIALVYIPGLIVAMLIQDHYRIFINLRGSVNPLLHMVLHMMYIHVTCCCGSIPLEYLKKKYTKDYYYHCLFFYGIVIYNYRAVCVAFII
jgi:hypothetical protein